MPTLTINKSTLVNFLENGYVDIDYTKKNGEQRCITATLLHEETSDEEGDGVSEHVDDDAHVMVWDAKVSGWRNLILASIDAAYIHGPGTKGYRIALG